MDVFTRGNVSVYSMLEKHNDGVHSLVVVSRFTRNLSKLDIYSKLGVNLGAFCLSNLSPIFE